MEKALAIQKQVIDILGTEEVYLVGGSVRDLVMGNEPKDYDFCTPLTPDEMKAKLKEVGRKAYNIGNGNKHGTVGIKVPMEDSHKIEHVPLGYEYVEVTTFRSEVYPNSGRQPEVTFVASLDEDLARRDFTMNAMVLRPDGTIYDPYGGKLDIHSKHIKTVGMPKERIMEDPLRMLRAARFAARYDFTIDANFIGKARQLADRIYDVSIERWVMELDKMLISEHYEVGQEALHTMGLWYRILPEMYGQNVLPLNNLSSGTDVDLAWKQLLEGIDSNQRVARYINSGICQRLKFSNDRTDIIIGKK